MHKQLLLVAALALSSVACSATTSSRNIRTAGVVALIDVTSQSENQAVVQTKLVVGGANSNTHVVLEGGDRLYAESAGQRQDMNSVSEGAYEAKFATSGGEYTVGLNRDVDTPAPNNKGTMPPPFEITSQFDDSPISRAKGEVTVTWSPSGGGATVKVSIEGDCVVPADYDVGGDPGTFTIAPKLIKAWMSQEKDNCNVNITVERTVTGSTDPALDSDSRFRLHQTRSARFVSGP
jgi:hypothetical protein